MKRLTTTFVIGFATLAIGMTGCKPGPSADSGSGAGSATADAHGEAGAHAHPTEGPHHGGLIELGNEEYHAELVHDDEAGSVTIYVLDSAATQQVPIDATEITINATHDGKPEQFSLAASPDANDPEGKSSRFVSTDKELAMHLDEEGAEPRLVLTIDGKSYRGTIQHDHEGHDDHDH